jgi:hypothetical protein
MMPEVQNDPPSGSVSSILRPIPATYQTVDPFEPYVRSPFKVSLDELEAGAEG